MPKINITTEFNAPIKAVFDACRDIELHQLSAKGTNEKAIDGKKFGLIGINESVTWRAKHFGVYQKLTVIVTEMKSPVYFRDEMTKGIFKRLVHDHYFEFIEGKTIMSEIFDYTSPLGFFGKIADFLFLKKYMTNFLIVRNRTIKEQIEKGNNF